MTPCIRDGPSPSTHLKDLYRSSLCPRFEQLSCSGPRAEKNSSFTKQKRKRRCSVISHFEYIFSCPSKVKIPERQRSSLMLDLHSPQHMGLGPHQVRSKCSVNGWQAHPAPPAHLLPAPGGHGGRTYLAILGAVGLRLGQATGG